MKKKISLLLLDISLFFAKLSMQVYPTQTMSIDLETATRLFLNGIPEKNGYTRIIKE